MKKFTEWMEEHTLLAHYRVEDPRLLHQISNMDGTEVDVDDDEQGGLVTIDSITHQKTALELKKMAAVGQIRSVAGETTRDMTGKARPMGTQYLKAHETSDWDAWNKLSDEGKKIEVMANIYRPKFVPLVKKLIEDEFHPSGMEPQVRRAFWLGMGQIFMEMARSYDAQ